MTNAFVDADLARDLIARAKEKGHSVSFGANNELLLDHQHVLDPSIQRCPICLAISWPEWGEPKEVDEALAEDLAIAKVWYESRVARLSAWYAARKNVILTDTNAREWYESLPKEVTG